MKSIMHSKDDGTCYLCMKLHCDYDRRFYLHEHHVVFGKVVNRSLSEKYGLKVYLCPQHHEYSVEAVHSNAEIRQQLCIDAQRAFEHHYPDLSFRGIFGKNYIAEKPEALSKQEGLKGFWFIESEE